MIWPSQRLPNCDVVAVAARDPTRAAEFAKQHGIPTSYGRYEDLLADPDVDAVREIPLGDQALCSDP